MKKLIKAGKIFTTLSTVGVLLGSCANSETGDRYFEKIQLSAVFYAEGAAVGDVNGNGYPDVICGPFWYEGPNFERKHAYYEPVEFDPLEYSDHFITAVADVNDNGLNDILVVGFPGQEAWWYENPGNESNAEYWQRHLIFERVDNESPAFIDLTGNGKPELIFHTDGYLGYATPDTSDPTKPWTFYNISEYHGWGRYTHGLGLGDITGNGHKDFLMRDSWWENTGDYQSNETWTFHPADFGPGGAQMYAMDVDGDGLNDVITSLEAHGWGLAWYRQIRTEGKIHFEKHLIMGDSHDDNPYGIRFSQPHAVILSDLNNSGLKGIVTGKRFWAHGPDGDLEPNAPAVIYWFKLERHDDGSAKYIPVLIDDDSGVGTQIASGDLTGNGYPDLVTCNKKGGFVFLNRLSD